MAGPPDTPPPPIRWDKARHPGRITKPGPAARQRAPLGLRVTAGTQDAPPPAEPNGTAPHVMRGRSIQSRRIAAGTLGYWPAGNTALISASPASTRAGFGMLRLARITRPRSSPGI